MPRSKSRLRQVADELNMPYSTLQRWTLEMIEAQRKSVQAGGWPKPGEEMTLTTRGLAQIENLARLRRAGLKTGRAIALLEDLGALDDGARAYWVALTVSSGVRRRVARISTRPLASDLRSRVVALTSNGFLN
jgi:hypothetical protein